MKKLENSTCQATQGLDSDVDSTGSVETPQLQSIDEVVEVPEPLEEAVSIPVEALMARVGRWRRNSRST